MKKRFEAPKRPGQKWLQQRDDGAQLTRPMPAVGVELENLVLSQQSFMGGCMTPAVAPTVHCYRLRDHPSPPLLSFPLRPVWVAAPCRDADARRRRPAAVP